MDNNKNNSNYGFNQADFETFKTTYAKHNLKVAHNDYFEVQLFTQVRDGIGKKNFQRLLTEGLYYTPTQISNLQRKMAAYRQIRDGFIWDLGYSAVQKLLDLPANLREEMLTSLRSEKSLTWSTFNGLLGNIGNIERFRGDTINQAQIRGSQIQIDPSRLAQIIAASIEQATSRGTQHGRKESRRNRGKSDRHQSRNERRNKRRQSRQGQGCSKSSIFSKDIGLAMIS